MGAKHNNTAPAKTGSYNLSKAGLMSYFPIQDAGFLQPYLALMIFERPDGEVFIGIDQRWAKLDGMDE